MRLLEDSRETSGTESFRGLVQYSVRLRYACLTVRKSVHVLLLIDQHRFRIVLLIDQSKSVAAESENIQTALNKFVDELVGQGECQDVHILIAGFTGKKELDMYTSGFVNSHAELSSAIAEIGTKPITDPSTNLYGATISALQLLIVNDDVDGMALLTFSDGTDKTWIDHGHSERAIFLGRAR